MSRTNEEFMLDVFENLDVPEGVHVEFLNGEIVMMASATAIHNRTLVLLGGQFSADFDAMATQGVRFSDFLDRPEPDLLVTAAGAVPGNPNEVPAEYALLVVEIVSPENQRRDLVDKRKIYARGGIPCYLIVNPIVGRCTLLTLPDPAGRRYRASLEVDYGGKVPLPEPLGFDVDTARFQLYPPEK
ncbi:Uma2 family endonuclease [Allostreptomyces psammosilenae]|uniref:Uma2 family endonuclease n=1 Tax=Allostreptomyces psammosilenae TaxID=1892865 RepID=A0A852ZNI9_9ACTN|nr:Uma2 family endonuclease [Allostreptomyces psammosilenae]NYI03235.1 Uma2 family endonuclease [Allostreptomyces psammosilenae]